MPHKKTLTVIVRSPKGQRTVVISRPKLSRAASKKIRDIRTWEEHSSKLNRIVSGPVA